MGIGCGLKKSIYTHGPKTLPASHQHMCIEKYVPQNLFVNVNYSSKITHIRPNDFIFGFVRNKMFGLKFL